MSAESDQLDSLLAEYDRRKQDETRRMVRQAFRLENARKKGAEHLRRFALPHAREVAEKLQQAGHRVVYQEFLDAYPPNVRLHLYPRRSAMRSDEAPRSTFELVWGEPDPDRLFARSLVSGAGAAQELGSAAAMDLDELWVRERFLNFVRTALDLG